MQKKGSLTNRIPILRAEMRWSQQDLADRVGVSRQTIASLEANKYNPSLMLAYEIANQFNKNIYEIFDYKFVEGE